MPKVRIREVREARGESLRAVARAIGMDPADLSRIERGMKPCPDGKKVMLARYFGASVESLFFAELVDKQTTMNGEDYDNQ